MTDLTIRPARARDAHEMRDMIEALAAHHGDRAVISAEELVLMCFGPAPWLSCLVAQTDDGLIGYAALQRVSQLHFARRMLEVAHLYVAPHSRGQGAGRALIEAACAQGRALGCTAVTLGAARGNTAAQAFYARAQFRPLRPSGSCKLIRPL